MFSPRESNSFSLKNFLPRRKYIFIFFVFTIFIINMNTEFYTRLSSIILATFSTLLIPIVYPDLTSLSQCWSTNLQPLFVVSNIITAYIFFTLPSWRIPSVFLILLTAFPYTTFLNTHNFLAVCFFLSSLYVLWVVKRLPVYFWLFLFLSFIFPFSFLWGEISVILVLCIYHFHLLLYKEKLYNRNL